MTNLAKLEFVAIDISGNNYLSWVLVEQNNELLIKNHESRPTGSNPFHEANEVIQNNENNRSDGRGRGHGFSRQSYHGRPSYLRRGHMSELPPNTYSNKKWNHNSEKNGRAKNKSVENICYRRIFS
ncbi:hypothetical protein LIER_26289 [Lithospermum erythrorhizon]|uniref:Uncharacterized protein n=1 Tax=Lithospermum erythrorhizon TaxID=34254 RepID=A0AAV3R9W8_LITER